MPSCGEACCRRTSIARSGYRDTTQSRLAPTQQGTPTPATTQCIQALAGQHRAASPTAAHRQIVTAPNPSKPQQRSNPDADGFVPGQPLPTSLVHSTQLCSSRKQCDMTSPTHAATPIHMLLHPRSHNMHHASASHTCKTVAPGKLQLPAHFPSLNLCGSAQRLPLSSVRYTPTLLQTQPSAQGSP